MTPVPDAASVLKAYDVRGAAPERLSPALCAAYAVAFAELVDPDRAAALLLGRDLRTTSEKIASAIISAVTTAGWDIVDLGACSTDLLYFGSGDRGQPGIMVTASHNPSGDNGLKFCRAGAKPIGRDDGLAAVAERAQEIMDGARTLADTPGTCTSVDLSRAYAQRLTSLSPVQGRRLTVVVDAGNAVAGVTAPVVLGGLDLDLVSLYFEADGTFPHHDPNPLDPANLVDLSRAVREHDADIGLAFDGDADRCFVVDETGAAVSSSAITCLIAERVLARHPGATILHNLICSRAVPETITACGGVPVRTPVGHSLIKARMAQTGARFGGEHSGHFYFADFYLADSGMLAALHVLGALASTTGGLSELVAPFETYVASGEVNSVVTDSDAAMRAVIRAYERHDGTAIDRLDGVSVRHGRWWFNVRASNTESMLRLNVEATERVTMEQVRDDVLALIRDA